MKWKPILSKPTTELGVGNNYCEKYLNYLGVNEELYTLLLNPPTEHSAMLMDGMEELIPALLDDIKQGRRIVIAGDYDADGVTATTILYQSIKHLGGVVDYIIPHRIHDGYGLNVNMIKKMKSNADVIITCDNGISAHEAINEAKSYGIKVYVTDHHTPGAVLPNADIIVHPALGKYPFAFISGATVTYKIAQCLMLERPDKELSDYFLQLASISIVSDVMPVASMDIETMKMNENRGLLNAGIESMKKSLNWRLQILFEMMNINADEMDETTIGFYVSPVINAVGRLDDASGAVQFMTAETKDQAILKCSIMTYLNEERKKLKKKYYTEVKSSLDTSQSAIIVQHKEIHEGLIGIIAGNLADEYARPAVVFAQTEVEYEDGTIEKAWKASSRSNTVHLYECLAQIETAHPETIYRFGGHAGAAGLTVLDSKFDDFKTYFLEEVEKKNAADTEVKYYLFVAAQDVEDFGKSLKKLKPFGNGFPKPVIKTKMLVTKVDAFNASKHVKLSNTFNNELWLYGAYDEFKESGFLDSFTEAMNNKQKLMFEKGFTEEEAEDNKWQRYRVDANVDNLKLDMFLELDYGFFRGEEKTQTRVLEYTKA